MFFNWFGYFLLWLTNWEFKNTLNVDKAIIIGFPHTSWFDSFIIWCVSLIINIKGVMKSESLFLKFIASICGFIKVNRKGNLNQTKIIANYISNYNGKIYVSIAPEGTRKKKEFVKSGFYYIAKSSGIPIICGILNYKTRTFSLSKPIYVNNLSIKETIKEIKDYYNNNNATETTLYPENISNFEIEN